MIRFKQLDTGTPKDILAITDDSQGELAMWTEMFEEAEWEDSQTAQNLQAAERDADGNAEFVIPGDEAGEVADLDNDLAEFLEEQNAKALREIEEHGR